MDSRTKPPQGALPVAVVAERRNFSKFWCLTFWTVEPKGTTNVGHLVGTKEFLLAHAAVRWLPLTFKAVVSSHGTFCNLIYPLICGKSIVMHLLNKIAKQDLAKSVF